MKKPVVLVTGCGSGIGLALAELLYSERAFKVVVTARSNSLSMLKNRFIEDDQFIIRELDVTNHENIRSLIADVVVLSVQESSGETVVAIRDTGIGIPDEEKERIFNRYAQIGKKNRTGIGLGLYISKTIIESHGGRLWVTSAPDKGSIFNFSLPNKR